MPYKICKKPLVTYRRSTDRPETETTITRLPDVRPTKRKCSKPLLHRSGLLRMCAKQAQPRTMCEARRIRHMSTNTEWSRSEEKPTIKRLPGVRAKKEKCSKPLLHKSVISSYVFQTSTNPHKCAMQEEYDTSRKHTKWS